MDNRKNNGGPGRGQGRKPRYSEKTKVVSVRVPESKIPHFLKIAKETLKNYKMNTEQIKAKIQAQGVSPSCVDAIDDNTYFIGLVSNLSNRIALKKAGFYPQLGQRDAQHIIIKINPEL